MNIDLQTIKDIVLISVPIITAYFTYRANKKSKKELNNELEVRLREQDNETANEIKKMQKQLEVRNMENSWNTSTPTTQKYLDEVDVRRSGNVMSLQNLIPTVLGQVEQSSDLDELKLIKEMLLKIELPFDAEYLLPYEIPFLIQFKRLLNFVDQKINNMARYVHFDVRASRRSRKQIQPISSEKIEICLVRFKSISSREHIHYFRKPA